VVDLWRRRNRRRKSRATALLQKSLEGKELTDESEAKLDPIFRMCLGSPAPVNSSDSGTLQSYVRRPIKELKINNFKNLNQSFFPLAASFFV
jgi:hypothetical protein